MKTLLLSLSIALLAGCGGSKSPDSSDKNAPLSPKEKLTKNMQVLHMSLAMASQATGKLPADAKALGKTELDDGTVTRLLDEGKIVVNWGADRSGIKWFAYEKDAPVSGGLIAAPDGVHEKSAEEVKKIIGK